MKTAVAFLTTNPKKELITFAHHVRLQTPFDVFIVTDDEKNKTPSTSMVSIINIPDSVCEYSGFVNATKGTYIEKTPIAIDKFLYAFCVDKREYDYVWLIEDDVFIPSVDALKKIHEAYTGTQLRHYADLIISKHEFKSNDIMDWHWNDIAAKKIRKPWFRSLACVARLSRNLLNAVKEYVDVNKTLFNSEVMFNTLAQHNRLKVATPPELRSISWKAEWSLDDTMILPNNLFHPVKGQDRHAALRLMCTLAKESGYQPVNKLPKFLIETEEP